MLTADAFRFDCGVGLGAVRTDFRLVPRSRPEGVSPLYSDIGLAVYLQTREPTHRPSQQSHLRVRSTDHAKCPSFQVPTRPNLAVVLMVVSIPVMARVGELIAEENYAHANELIQVVRKMAKLKFARGYRIE
jgi:hypothetical protein